MPNRDRMLYVAFPLNQAPPSASELWARVSDQPPASVPLTGAGTFCSGVITGVSLLVQSQSNRIDLTVQPITPISPDAPLANLGNLDHAERVAQDTLIKMISGLPILRLAVVYEESELTSSLTEAVDKIKAAVTDLPAPDGATELFYQTGLNVPINAVEGETALALRRWNVIRLMYMGGPAGQQPTIVTGQTAVGHMADVGTSGNQSIRSSERAATLEELAERAKILLRDGLNAFR